MICPGCSKPYASQKHVRECLGRRQEDRFGHAEPVDRPPDLFAEPENNAENTEAPSGGPRTIGR